MTPALSLAAPFEQLEAGRVPPSWYGPDLLACARRLMKPDSNVLVIGADNKAAGWIALEEAVAREVPFAIRVAEDVLAIDCDDLSQADVMEILDGMLRARGHEPLLLISGQGLHLWAIIKDPVRLERYQQIAKALGLDVRTGTMMRPPGSPHRLGLPCVRIARDFRMTMWRLPRTLQARGLALRGDGDWRLRHALAYLAAGSERVPIPSAPAPDRARRLLSQKLERLVREGVPEGQRSEAIMAVLVGAVNKHWDFEAILEYLLKSPLGQKLREKRNPRRWLAGQWKKAERFVAHHRAVAVAVGQDTTDHTETQAEVTRLREAVERFAWRGQAGTTDRLVVQAHLDIVERTRKLDHRASAREVAEMIGARPETVSTSHGRQRGIWLRLVAPHRGMEPAVWRVRLPRKLLLTPLAETPGLPLLRPAAPGLGVRLHVPKSTAPSHDLWRQRKGLGKAKLSVYQALDSDHCISVAALARRLHRKPCILRRHLRALKGYGLATPISGGWLRGPADPDQVAQELGVVGAGARQRAQHIRDREAFREAQEAWAVARLKRRWRQGTVSVGTDTVVEPASTVATTVLAARVCAHWAPGRRLRAVPLARKMERT